MARTETASPEARRTTALVLDTEAGTVEPVAPVFSVGAGATLAKYATTLKSEDRVTVNTAPAEKVEKNPIDLTVIDNITGASTHITANATVGIDTEGVRFNRCGTKTLAALTLFRAGVTRQTLSEDLIAALMNDDVAAIASLIGIDFDSDAWAETQACLDAIGEATTTTVAGRQQVSGYTVA